MLPDNLHVCGKKVLQLCLLPGGRILQGLCHWPSNPETNDTFDMWQISSCHGVVHSCCFGALSELEEYEVVGGQLLKKGPIHYCHLAPDYNLGLDAQTKTYRRSRIA